MKTNGSSNDDGNGEWPRKTPSLIALPIGLFNTRPETQNPPLAGGEGKPKSKGGTALSANGQQGRINRHLKTRRSMLA